MWHSLAEGHVNRPRKHKRNAREPNKVALDPERHQPALDGGADRAGPRDVVDPLAQAPDLLGAPPHVLGGRLAQRPLPQVASNRHHALRALASSLAAAGNHKRPEGRHAVVAGRFIDRKVVGPHKAAPENALNISGGPVPPGPSSVE